MSHETIHQLKTWPRELRAIVRGEKRFEVRKDDRGFRVGDRLRLQEWKPDRGEYTGSVYDVWITYILKGEFGMPADMVVMSISLFPPST